MIEGDGTPDVRNIVPMDFHAAIYRVSFVSHRENTKEKGKPRKRDVLFM